MKRIFLITSAVVIGLLTQATSCRKDNPVLPHACTDIACTMIFTMVTVEVKDPQGNPVILDEHYTIREINDKKVETQPGVPVNGTYTVIDDNFISTLTNRTEKFRFIGKKNGVEVINEPFTISGDCCHVNKESGKSEVILQ